MTRPEDIERVKQIISNAETARRKEYALKEAAEEAKKAEELREANENKAKLVATGIVTLFEAIRDAGIVKWNEEPTYEEREKPKLFGKEKVRVKVRDYDPAHIEVHEGSIGEWEKKIEGWRWHAELSFNGSIGSRSGSYSSIIAYLEKDGMLAVEGRDKMNVFGSLTMIDAVGMAISNPQKHYWEDPNL